MSTAIDNFVENGKFSFRDFTASIIKDLIKIELKMQAMQLFRMAWGAVSSAVSMYSGGGWGTGNEFGNQDQGAFLMGAGKANGGVINSPTLVGERGPELFIPGRSGTVIPNNNIGDILGNTGVTYNGPVIQNMNAIDTQSGLQFLAQNKMNIYALNQSAARSMPASR
jgi:phage-related minor tail protein